VWVVSGLLFDDRVNESRINSLTLARTKNNPVEVAISRHGYVRRYLLYHLVYYLSDGINGRRKCGTEEKSSEIEKEEKRKYGKWRKLR
jgi:hypothetical protein